MDFDLKDFLLFEGGVRKNKCDVQQSAITAMKNTDNFQCRKQKKRLFSAK